MMEVVPLASRHFSLEMSEVADVMDLLIGMESSNNVKLELRMGIEGEGKHRDLVIVLIAHDKFFRIGEAPPLASVSAKCLGMNLKHFRDAVIRGLYMLDGQIASNELLGETSKKA